ncbi:MAG TPA: glucose-6-phosphate dehydrogenase assembly protein OpcA [Solirubrobacteraceae bacterium]|nr:glucose-6-phosphate dehydrogenase assembly protein OpcA [Solirubrobacteraceae bacterium]
MSDDVWTEQNTDPDAIDAALREMLRSRHAADQTLAPARVLNLIVVVDRAWKGEISNRLARVGRYHASRTILCAVEDGRDTLDATAVMSYQDTSSGGIGVIRESVEIDMGPDHLPGLETIVDPIVISELPTVLWCPHGHEEAIAALQGITDVILLDSDDFPDADDGLARAQEEQKSAYVVDLAWLRTTPWRERLAASFDPPARRGALAAIEGFTIRHQPSSTASALLLAAWLASRLQWDTRPLQSANGAGLRGRAYTSSSRYIDLRFEPAAQDVPGLAGVTVTCAGYALSLDRARGGLRAHESIARHGEHRWLVLGASRGEGGILGEGVRQALLRDPTYGPALEVARGFQAHDG